MVNGDCILEPSNNIIILKKDTFFELTIKRGAYLYKDADRLIFNYILPDSAKDGKYILIYENNQIALKLNYKNNILNGPQLEYFFHGNRKSQKFFKSGKLNGTQYFFHLDPESISRIENYKNGLKHGLFISFFQEGHPSTIEFFKNGKLKKQKYKWGQNGKHNHSQIKN